MKRSGIRRLDLISGVTTTDQGGNRRSGEFSQSRDPKPPVRISRSNYNAQGGINEEPNESSLLPLPIPDTVPSNWSPPDVVRLVLVGGTLIILFVSILTDNKAVDSLLTVIASATAYYFGARSRSRASANAK